ncbi:MAG: hypothetical protein A2W98_14055 [Bacteroidetes bacterium GWF2_33_38]|nr:MAG: hypothetical protein A2W98_14055 [Bacteroidetes bacterium GWF2_33_38]OFY75315.1 MAG: hypothetical protein A2265_04685 [Bacteroidetes bacterium RIFOXYA12_FULL_33_9]OFY89316.1 MAG: hypothetical protein A2236_07010 [Bacteroidetes bacterium RIFOXYA2_FULL_33_7]
MFETDKKFSYSEFKPSEKEYKIRPFDKLEVRITTNDGFKLINIEGQGANIQQGGLEYLVEFDGKVKVPTLGRIDIAGYTIREAEAFLESKYKDFYQNPFVLIKVTNRRVVIFSSGSESANVLNIEEENFTLVEAIAKTGGLSDASKAYKIKLIRGDLNNPEIYVFNISSIRDMKEANFFLQANDIIYIDAKPRYASRILADVNPYISLLTTIILVYSIFAK